MTFERGGGRTFDLLVGADGLHSITRRLVFGPEESFLRFLGGYLAVFTVPNYLQLENRMVGFTVPGRTAALYPVGDRSQTRVVLGYRPPGQQGRRVHRGTLEQLTMDELSQAMELNFFAVARHQSRVVCHAGRADRPGHHRDEFEWSRGSVVQRRL